MKVKYWGDVSPRDLQPCVPPAPPSPPRRSSLRNTPSSTPHAPSSYAHNVSHNTNPSTLIMGDSNTKYVNLPHANYHRIPTILLRILIPSNVLAMPNYGYMSGSITSRV